MRTIELEKTYLPKRMPEEIADATPERMIDVYIMNDVGEHPNLRVRQRGDRFVITKKYPMQDGDASRQIENSIPIDKTEFGILRRAQPVLLVEKDRYNVEIAGHPAEVDVFRGDLAGLVLIDFEFATPEEQEKFGTPEVALADVTNVGFIAGGLLAGKTYADIESRLKDLGYKKL
jgi:CYTH domain-containing protein